jgi:hypothetical protein
VAVNTQSGAYQQKSERLPDRIRAEVLRRYEQITGKKP